MRKVSFSIALPTWTDVKDMGNTLRSATSKGLDKASKKMAPKPKRATRAKKRKARKAA